MGYDDDGNSSTHRLPTPDVTLTAEEKEDERISNDFATGRISQDQYVLRRLQRTHAPKLERFETIDGNDYDVAQLFAME
jgi:hypothetical protein